MYRAIRCQNLATAPVVLALIAFFSFYAQASAQTYYTTVGIGSFRTIGNPNSIPYSINSSGQVVGFANTDTGQASAFLWQNGTLTNIGASLPYYSESSGASQANGINDSGIIVGEGSFAPNTNVHAFLLENGVFTDLHPLIWQSGVFTNLGNEQGGYSRAHKINNAGQVLGEVYSNGLLQGFVYHNGVFARFGCNGIDWLNVGGINNLGEITGNCAGLNFIWNAGVTTNIGSLSGNSNAPADINDAGQVVGQGPFAHAFLYANGVMTDLGTLVPSGGYSQALAINNFGQVVGWGLADVTTGEAHGFIYRDGAMKDINDLTQFNPDGYLRQCMDINDQGQIICSRRLSTGWYRAEVLNPVQDTTAPQIYAYDSYVAATSAQGANVGFGVSVADDFDRHPTITYSQAPGTLFPIGTTTVMVTARDASGNTTLGSFQVNVIDYPPDLTLPEAIFTDATGASGAVVNYIASAYDAVDGDRPVTCSPSSGATFPIGETVVDCSSSDTKGHSGTASFRVFVLGSEQEATVPGYDVPVTSTDSGLSLTFAYVDQPGITTIAPIDPGTIGTTPSGFAVSDVAYEISTTSAGAADNGVQLAFVVPNTANMSRTDFESLRVLHNNNGTLEDVTTGYDYDNRIVYAYTYSFSPFYLGRKVTTNIETLFDLSRAHKAGSTIPVKLRVRDGTTNANLSSSALIVTARTVKRLGESTALTVNDSGSANPDSNFRYLGEKDGGSYLFNLSTKGLQSGSYALSFYVGNDRSFFYTVKFEVK